jgi:hypothetical protein
MTRTASNRSRVVKQTARRALPGFSGGTKEHVAETPRLRVAKKAIVAGTAHRQELQRRQHDSPWYTRHG